MKRPSNLRRSPASPSLPCRSTAFTLIELMVVVAIMGIVMSISIPFMHTSLSKRQGMNGAIRDLQEICKLARDWSILQQTSYELRIRPHDGVFELGGASSPVGRVSMITQPNRLSSEDLSGNEWRIQDSPAPAPSKPEGNGSQTLQLPQGIIIEGLGVNGEDWTEDEVARVRFYDDGTSDSLSVVLFRAETNERRNVWLEIVTGLAEVESDPSKFRVQ